MGLKRLVGALFAAMVVGIALFAGVYAFGQASQVAQGVFASYVRMTPSSLPAICRQGDIRFSLSAGNLQVCSPANTWSAVNTGGGGFTNPMTTSGDMIYGGASGAATRLPAGTAGYILQTNGAGSAPTWVAGIPFSSVTGNLSTSQLPTAQTWPSSGSIFAGTPTAHDVMVSSTTGTVTMVTPTTSGYVLTSNGTSTDPSFQPNIGFNNPMTTLGDLIVGGTAGSATRLAVGSTAGSVLASNGSAQSPSWQSLSGLALAGSAPAITTYLSGSGTYTVPANAIYLTVQMVGGGGGGGGGGTSSGTASTSGGNTTFGTSLLVANGGSGGANYGGAGGAGGTASLGTGPVGVAYTGAVGTAGSTNGGSGVTSFLAGGPGASTPFAGGGAGQSNASGTAGVTNSGGGGGGGGTANAVGAAGGSGGGAGGYVNALITSPAASYAYSVGSGGSAGGAASSGYAGGAGASGLIIVTAYFPTSSGAAVTQTIQKFLSGSGTYTTPANVISINVVAVGGGGGGGGSSTAAANNGAIGGNGGATTFGTSLISAGGGSAGPGSGGGASGGGAGGTSSLGTGPIGIAQTGNSGGAQTSAGTSGGVYVAGGSGGPGFLMGGASGGGATSSGNAGAAYTGAGGGGAGSPANGISGAGGGSGGFVNAIINSPAASYPYSIGAGGSAGTPGTGGSAGGAGGGGFIIVYETYANGAIGTATNITATSNSTLTSLPNLLLNLGTSATGTNPQKATDATTGLYSSAAGTVSVASGGTDILDVNSSGLNLGSISDIISWGGNRQIAFGTTLANQSTWIGYLAGQNTPASSSFITAIGQGALQNLSSSQEDVAIGVLTANQMVSGNFDTAVGQHCLGYDTTSSSVTCIGNDAMRNAVNVGSSFAGGKATMAWGGHSNEVGIGFTVLNGNSGTVTIGGTGTLNDVVSVTFTCTPTTNYTCSFSGSPVTVSYTVTSTGQTAASIASGLSAAINANSTLAANADTPSISAVLGSPYPAGVITFTFSGTATTGRGIALSTNVTGSATETMAVTNGYAGQYNTAFGSQTMQMQEATTAGFNFGVGKYTLENLTTGSYNIAIGGYNTAQSVTSGGNNLIMCQACASNLTTGSSNIVMGGSGIAGTNLTTGSSNILIGPSSLDALTAGGSNYIDIGNVYFGDDSVKSAWIGAGTLATTATDGFLELSSTSGTPTGVPTSHSGYIPIVYNTATNALWGYNSGWQNLSGSGGSSTLGTAVGTPSPYRSGQATTGLFSATSGYVSFASSGADVLDVTPTGINLASGGTISQGGTQTVKILTGGNNSVAIGNGAVAVSTRDIAIGSNAGLTNTSGYQSVIIGGNADSNGLGSVTNSVAIGDGVMQYTPGLNSNVAIGENSQAFQGSNFNVSIGNGTLESGAGPNNTAVGGQAFVGNSSTAVVGGTLTTGDIISYTLTGSFTGSPVTVTYTVLNTDTLATVSTGIKAAVNANTTLSAAYITANTATSPAGTVFIDLYFPGTKTTGLAITQTYSVSGSATETMTFTNGMTGYENTAIGYNAMLGEFGMSAANDNLAIGKNVLPSLTTAAGNAAMGGFNTGQRLTSGSYNLMIGTSAASLLTTGGSNVIIGSSVGSTTLTTGSFNVLIGTNSSTDTTTSSATNEFHLGLGSTDAITITGGGAPATESVTINGTISAGGPVISKGTKFTASGCSNTTTLGGADAGSLVSGTTGTCTVVITINGATGATAPNGWSCWANDLTTANTMRQTAYTTTTATISGTTVSGDLLTFGCKGF